MKFPLSVIPHNTKIDFIGARYIAFTFSIFLTLATIVLLNTHGLNKGIDFTGGIIMELQSATPLDMKELRNLVSSSGYAGANLQELDGSNIVMLRVQPKGDNSEKEVSQLKSILSSVNSDVNFRRVDYVGPRVGGELMQKGAYAMLMSLVAMMIYIWLRFSWQFGIGAILALFHDAIITLGFYVITGYEFDLTSIAAILTIIGYSINDTVVIYDRIRDNLAKHKNISTAKLLNLSINETLSRTIMTVVTTAVVCLALVLFGGHAIKGFSAAVLFGILFGTYSSICISAPVLLYTKIK